MVEKLWLLRSQPPYIPMDTSRGFTKVLVTYWLRVFRNAAAPHPGHGVRQELQRERCSQTHAWHAASPSSDAAAHMLLCTSARGHRTHILRRLYEYPARRGQSDPAPFCTAVTRPILP